MIIVADIGLHFHTEIYYTKLTVARRYICINSIKLALTEKDLIFFP